ncbi:hypothetical protein SLS62_007652 [Diatrype stigma]|uniref:SLS1 C-terminal domain-containing protein n=1 Tax=Diatrype stigma TaxID=117547 RepID=A0AAN9UPF3_9PEZI
MSYGRVLEDLRHVVYRLLWTALAPERAFTALYAETAADQTSSEFIVDKTNKEKWGWKDRMADWARYVLPLTTSEALLSNGAVADSSDKINKADGPLQTLPLPIFSATPRSEEAKTRKPLNLDELYNLASPERSVKWAENVKTTTTAHFGHLLHSYPPTGPQPPPLPELLEAHHPRIFSPVTPHPLHLAKLASTGTEQGSVEHSSYDPSIDPPSDPSFESSFASSFESSFDPSSEPSPELSSEPLSEPSSDPSSDTPSDPSSDPFSDSSSPPPLSFYPPHRPVAKTKSTIVIRFWPSPNSNPGAEPALPKDVTAKPARGRRPKKLWRDEDVDAELAAEKAAEEAAEEAAAQAEYAAKARPPILELRLATTDTEILGVESLRAVIDDGNEGPSNSRAVSDVMLPEAPVDLRVNQTQYVDLVPPAPLAMPADPHSEGAAIVADWNLRAREALARWPPLADFLSNARLDLASGKLDMPPRQRFPVPRRLFFADEWLRSLEKVREEEKEQEEEEQEDEEEEGGRNIKTRGRIQRNEKFRRDRKKKSFDTLWREMEQVDKRRKEAEKNAPEPLLSTSYEFVGLEMHRSVSIPYDYYQDHAGDGDGPSHEHQHKHILTYTSIEAGQGGGRRAEVTIEPVAAEESGGVDSDPQRRKEEEEKRQKEFLACCYGFAKDNTLWSGYLPNLHRY